MNYQEFQKISAYKYEDYVKYLKEKYGVVPEDYCSKGFTPNMNIKRKQSDNLYIHHIREDKVANLSDMSIAATAPFEYQQAHNLVYCNLLEHILLHIMIGEQNQGLGFGGAQLMIMQANDYYPNGNDILEELKTRCENSLAAYEILLEHNMTLFYDLDDTLMTSDRALVVLGTGLGKTTTALAYLKKYNYKAIVLCPNNTIVLGWKDNPEVTAITYQKFMNSYMKEDYSKYQVLICDEAHHCTAARWGEGIRYVLDNGLLKVIGLTATPKEKKDKKNFETTAEFFNGKVCKGYTVLDGIENEKIHDFSYVGAIYDTSGLREKYANIDDKTLLGELDLELNNTPTMDEILTKHMPTSKRKGIIFVSSIEAMEEAESIMRNLYPNMEYRRLHSLLPNADVEDTRNWFQNTDEGYLLAVNMISEGAHYKGVNTLIMFRRTQSSLVFNQQLGRIITLARDEDPHAIVFDLVNNANLIENEGDRFAASLKEAYRARKERSGREKSSQIIIADYAEKISIILKKIQESISRFWSDGEIDILKNYYLEHAEDGKIDITPLLALLPKRSKTQIINQASYLGFANKKRLSWTEEEDAILKTWYPQMGNLVAQKLEGRSLQAILQRASLLKIVYNNPNAWTQEEVNILLEVFPLEGVNGVMKRLPYRAKKGIQAKACSLGIKMINPNANRIGGKATAVIWLEHPETVYPSIAKASEASGCNKSDICNCCKGKAFSSHGQHFLYSTDPRVSDPVAAIKEIEQQKKARHK